MNVTKWLVLALAGGVAGASAFAQDQTPAVIPVEAPAQPAQPAQPPGQEDVLIQRIRTAQDPSSAIQAYAEARAFAPNDLAPLKAYVHRMAEMGLPEMADVQTQDLLSRAPEDGVAWAVAGYIAAKRDQMDAAASDLAAAVRLTPDDPFVQRTAGQLVAWADTRPDKSVVTAPIRASIDTLRSKLNGKAEYTQAYQDALTAYQRLAEASAATQPAPSPAQSAQPAAAQPAPATEPVGAIPSPPAQIPPADDSLLAPTYVPGTLGTPYTPVYPNSYPSYYEPPYYPYSYGYYGPSWYSGLWFGASWWWPTASSVVIVDNDCRRHFNDHHWDWNSWDTFRRQGELKSAHGLNRNDAFWDRRFFGQDRWPGDRFLGRSPQALLPIGGARTTFPRPDGRGDRWGGTWNGHPGSRTDNRTALTTVPPGRSPVARVDPPNRAGAGRDGWQAIPGGVIRFAPPQRVATPSRPQVQAPPQAMPAGARLEARPAPAAPRTVAPPAPRMVAPPPRVAAPAPSRVAAPERGSAMSPAPARASAPPAAPARAAAPAGGGSMGGGGHAGGGGGGGRGH